MYYVDIKYYDGVLNKVDDGDAIEELMASPAPGQRAGDLIRASAAKEKHKQMLLEYKLNPATRESLRRSMASKHWNI